MTNRPDYSREDVLREANKLTGLHSSFHDAMDGAEVSLTLLQTIAIDYAALLARVEQFRKVLQSPLKVETTTSRAYAKRLDVLDDILRGTHD